MKNFKSIILITSVFSGLLIGCGGNSSTSSESTPTSKDVLNPVTKQEVPHSDSSIGMKTEQDDSALQANNITKEEAPLSKSTEEAPLSKNQETETP